jgi:hypothetical protein
MNFDFKIVIWARINVHDDDVAEQILSDIKSGKINGTSDEIFNLACELGSDPLWEVLDDTTEKEFCVQAINDDGETVFTKEL